MEIDPLDMNGGVVPPRISWAAVVYSFFHSFASQESQQHFFLDYLERKVTGSRDRWKHVILLDAMMCLVHGKTQTRPYIAQERGFCHHAAFQNAVIVAMEAAVEGNTTSPTRSAPNHMESSNAKQPTSHRSNSTRSSPDRGSSSNKSSKQAGKNPVDSNNLGGPFTEKELEVAKNSWLHGLICNASEEKLAQARSSADYSEHYGVTEDNRTEALGDEYLWLFEPPDTGASSSSKFGEVKPSMDWNGKGVPRKWEIQSFSSPVAVSPLENVPLVSLGLLRDIHSPWFEFKHFRDGFLTLMYETHIYGPETSAVQNHRYTAHRMQVLDDYGRSPALSTGTLAELCVRACECALQQTVNGMYSSVYTQFLSPSQRQSRSTANNLIHIPHIFPNLTHRYTSKENREAHQLGFKRACYAFENESRLFRIYAQIRLPSQRSAGHARASLCSILESTSSRCQFTQWLGY